MPLLHMGAFDGQKYEFRIGNISRQGMWGSLLTSFRSLLLNVDDDGHSKEFEKCINDVFTPTKNNDHRSNIDHIISKFESLVYYFNQFHICLIDNRQNSDLVVHYFKNKILPDVPTVYIILTNEGFKPLYVVNKQKPEEKYKTMIHDEVKHLLQNFIHRTLKYKDPVDLEFDISIEADDNSLMVATDDEISNLICDDFAPLKKQPKPRSSTNTSFTVPSIDITKRINNTTPSESAIERDETTSSEKRTSFRRPINEKTLTEVTKRIRRSGPHSEKIADDSYECCTYDPPGDGSCFYWCIKHLVNDLTNASTANLRSMTASFIENDPNLRLFAPQSHATNTNISISDYCASVRGSMFAGDPECTAMMALCCQEIFLFVIDTENKTYWEKSYKFDDRNVSGRIYLMLFDEEEHFQGLYMQKKTNPHDQIKEFSSSDETAQNLFRKYIETSTGVKLKDDSRSSSKKRKESNMDIEQSSSQLGPIVKRPRAEIKSTMNSSCSQTKTHFLGLKIMLKADLTKLTPCTLVIQLVSDNLVGYLTYKFRVQEAGDKITYRDEVHTPLSIDKREITLIILDTSRSNHPPIQEFVQHLDFYKDTQGLLTTLELGQYPTFQQAHWIHGLSFKMFLTGESSGAYAATDCIDKIFIASRYISNRSSSRISHS